MIPDDGKLKPSKLSFHLLKGAVNLAAEKYLAGIWTENNVQSYVSSVGLNQNGIKLLIEHCNNARTLQYMQNDVEVQPILNMINLTAIHKLYIIGN